MTSDLEGNMRKFSTQQVPKTENSSISYTLIETGYIVPPISKLPFLNIMTEVLLMQVPVPHGHKARGHLTIKITDPPSHAVLQRGLTPTFRKYQDGKFGLGCNMSSQPEHTDTEDQIHN